MPVGMKDNRYGTYPGVVGKAPGVKISKNAKRPGKGGRRKEGKHNTYTRACVVAVKFTKNHKEKEKKK